jgi:hypothetical protein
VVKVGIVIRWVTFLALDFLVHLTIYGPPNYIGGIQVNQMFSTKDVGIQGLEFTSERRH